MKKKFLALVLTLAMVLSLVPMTALAGNTSLLSITPDEGIFATYEFYTSKTAENPCYTQIVKTGDTLKRPADPTLAGSHFTGWKTADGKEVPFGMVTVKETSIIKCYAQWEENKNPIHVYFMAAIGSNEVMHTGVAQNGAVDIPPDYQDITWKTENNEVFDGTNVTEDMKVYPASAFCWLTFDSQGGSAIASHYVQQGESFELINVGNPTKAGYRFAGWSLEANGTKQTEVTPNGDTKLYALWTPTTADYTVIHWQENANDDEYSYIASEPLSGRTGDQTNAAAKSYQGFTATEIEQQTIKGDGSTIVNVYYQRNSYTIHFYYREYGSWKEYTDIQITAKYGADISTKWPEKKNSKTWSTNEKTGVLGSLKGPFQVNIQTMPLGGAKYYGPKTDRGSESAHYYVEVIPGESGTVTRGDVTYKLHHTDTSPGTGYEVTDEDKYELTGFNYKEGTRNGRSYDNAEFYYTRNSYNVVYFSNGVEVKKEPYKYEQDISGAGSYTPTAPAGYKFGGWYSDPIGTKKYDFSGKKMPAQHITVYAKWVPITLKLTIQDVDGVGSGDVNYNQAINEAGVYKQATDKLTAANKTVLYWVNCETNQKEDVNRQMTTNLTIRPVLKGGTYAVNYDSGATDSQKYWYNTIAKVKDYQGENTDKFLYWTDAAGTKYHPGDEIQMTANVTLTPNFSVENPGQTYSVTYHSNFGMDQEYTPEESIKNNALFTIKTYESTQLPNQEGYDFTGWNTKRDGTGEKFEANSTARMNGANDNDLYAQWQRCTYTLTYNANGGQFGSGDSAPTTKQESDIRAGDHSLNYSPEYIPTHAQSGDKNVVFIGWSTRDNGKKIYDKGENIPTLIKSIQMDGNKTVYAVWGYDAIGKDNKPDGVPDVFNAVVTYNIVDGTWDGTNTSATEVIKVKTFDETTKIWTNTNATLSNIPEPGNVIPNDGYTKTGTWDPNLDKTTPVTANKTYTYKLSPVTTGTLTITKKVVGDGLTVDSLPEDFQITVKDAQGETKGTLTKTDEAKKADDTLTWTIPDLAPGTYTVSESNADVKDYTYTTTYNNVAANSDTVNVEKNKTSTMTVTNTYTKNATVNLSQLIQKQLTVKKDSKLPTGTTFTVKVTPTPTGDQGTQDAIIGTTTDQWTGGIEAEGNTTYTVPFDFKTKNTLSLSAGTYTYTVQETPGDVSGMQYDSEKYTLTITIPESGEAPYQANSIIIKNTYQTPNLTVEKKPYKVNDTLFDADKTVAHVNDQIIWKVNVTNIKTTQASTELTETLTGAAVYSKEEFTDAYKVSDANGTWTATVPGGKTVTYYVTYKVQAADIPNGKIVNTIVKDGESSKPIESDPVSTWDTKQLKSATSLDTSDWTTTVTLTLPKVNENKEVTPAPIAVKSGSYVIDQIGNEFTFMDELSLKVNGTELSATQDTTNKNLYRFGTETEGVYPYTVTYTAKNDETKEPAQFTWNINENVYAGTEVTLSYKLKLTTPKTAAGTYGVEDLNGSGQIEQAKALYTNESAILYKKEENTKLAEFPKPSVSYTIKGSSGGHGGNGGGTVTIPDDVPTGLNGKDHYAYVVGYPDGMVYPQKNITRAEVATIFFRLLEDETREANMTKSNNYNDMKDGAWYTCAVSTLSKMGIIKGYEDGSFKPDASISRAEFAAIAARFDPDGDKTPATFSDVSSHWAKDEISIAANHGWIKGYEDGSFKPDQKITRAETMTLVNRVLKRLPETKDDLHKDMKTWPDNQNESAWFYLAVQEATNSHYQKLKKDGTHETWESMRETRDWAALEK